MRFEVQEVSIGDESFTVIRKYEEDGTVWSVPTDPANSDYQAYLKSLEPKIVEEPVVEEPPVEDVPAEDIPVTD